MKRLSPHLLLALCLALLAGCSRSSPGTGSARFAVAVPRALSSSISRISVTASADDFPSVSVDLVSSSGSWGGILTNLPAGPDRSFFAQAFDASGNPLFQGSASGVPIDAGQTALVYITLQRVGAPPPFENEAPVIDSLFTASSSVPVGGSFSLKATAHDPNPEDTLSYAWSSTAGAFSSPASASTTWTAPASTGPQTLTFTVTDSRGLASSVSLTVNVTSSGDKGSAHIIISFNADPQVTALLASPTRLVPGETTSVFASASDEDGDSLSYSWHASCAGSWSNDSSSSAGFTPSSAPDAACNNCRLTVTVSDGHGGQTTGTVALCVTQSSPVPAHAPPVIVSATASSDTASAGQVLSFSVVASDPEGSTLTFSWGASTGSPGTSADGAFTSSISWTAPSCTGEGTPADITVTVTNAFGLTATHDFAVTGLPVCEPPDGGPDGGSPGDTAGWVSTGSLAAPREGHTATLLHSGKVLVAGGFNASGHVATAEEYNPASGSWSAAGSLSSPRRYHTATVLADGKVLVAGGYNNINALAAAEVYDPVSGTWRDAASMTEPRKEHTATLLPNGKVLVAGGFNYINGPLATAEVYSPRWDYWGEAAPMNSPRSQYTATLLKNGKVLVAGGFNGDLLATAEVYDPATDTWSTTGSMAEPRSQHIATLLPNGKVLVLGGRTNDFGSVATAEVYDPATGTWSAAASLLTPRYLPTATLLNTGKVLVLGGHATGIGYLETAEEYDPATDTWSAAASMAEPRYDHTATLLNTGKVLVSGGYNSSGARVGAELYTPGATSAASGWASAGGMASPRAYHTATLLPNGKLLIAGGDNYNDILATAEVYDPASGTWSMTGSMADARGYHTATLLKNGKVLVSGGYSYEKGKLATAEVYDPASGTWSATGSMAQARDFHMATLLPNGKVLVSGGFSDSGYLATAEVYDPASGTWSATGSMAEPRSDHTATLLPNGKVLVSGGLSDRPEWIATAEVYDPASGSWSTTGSMSGFRSDHTATLLPNGKVLVSGGKANGGEAVKTAEVYDPASGSWSTTGSMASLRGYHTATLLKNGKVLVVGGLDTSIGRYVTTTEVYDPATGSWSASASMASSRDVHTATLLPNGKVLVSGGEGYNDVLTAAELYTP